MSMLRGRERCVEALPTLRVCSRYVHAVRSTCTCTILADSATARLAGASASQRALQASCREQVAQPRRQGQAGAGYTVAIGWRARSLARVCTACMLDPATQDHANRKATGRMKTTYPTQCENFASKGPHAQALYAAACGLCGRRGARRPRRRRRAAPVKLSGGNLRARRRTCTRAGATRGARGRLDAVTHSHALPQQAHVAQHPLAASARAQRRRVPCDHARAVPS